MQIGPQRTKAAVRLLAATAAGALLAGSFTACSTDNGGSTAEGDVTINVALAANPQMKTAESLISDFEQKNPGIKVKFTTLPENDLRPAVTKDVATKAGQYDVAMMGSYEVPIWAKNDWIVPLDDYVAKDTAWDTDDLLQPIKDIVSSDGKLYGAPFYGSSSFLFYRKDLAQKAGVTISGRRRPGKRSQRPRRRWTTRPGESPASACAVCRAGARTWLRSPRSSTPSAAAGSTRTGTRS